MNSEKKETEKPKPIVPLNPGENLIGYVVVAFVETKPGQGTLRTQIVGVNALMVPGMLKKAYRTLDEQVTAPS